jgi:saccharopine dehydrogenase-like NADP-dependent oxidoreductase
VTATPRRVLLFGSGRVALPVMKLFDGQNVHVTIATDDAKQAQTLMDCMSSPSLSSFVPFKFPQDNHKLASIVKSCDVAISLLPATMHIPIAEECINQGRHLVTASYVSPAMQALNARAKAAGVILLNEVGLDPGMDHMMIMKAIDDIHSRRGTVKELVSLCGGLPDPVAADNPLRYKFSWSPRGALNAAGNSAQYLANDEVVQVPGDKLLLAATPSNRFPTLRLEVLPNRDSLSYRELYGIPEVRSICRGTLRYEGS